MDKKIFVITSGCYSDYGISGIYSTRELAEEALGGEKDEDGYGSRIEEFTLDPGVAELREGLIAWQIWMSREGNTERAEKCGYRGVERSVEVYGLPRTLRVTCWATDKKHAIKITNEHRLQQLAAGAFDAK